jgi:hypothetical protein
VEAVRSRQFMFLLDHCNGNVMVTVEGSGRNVIGDLRSRH